MKTKIFIATHKKATFPQKEEYYPIQVGAQLKEELPYLKDNTGENISHKNPNFCELTALYWIWKNEKSDIVGLVHYRRYFFNKTTNSLNNVINEEDIEKILQKYDIIVPKPVYLLKYTVESEYEKFHNIEDYNKCRKIIEKMYPDYLHCFDKVSKQKHMYAYNMLITKKEIFNEYAQWMFSIIEELEKQIDIRDYSDYNKRVFGFISERLFNVWIMKNSRMKLKELPVYNTEESIIKQQLKQEIKKIIVTFLE